jgi:hypothetical protein
MPFLGETRWWCRKKLKPGESSDDRWHPCSVMLAVLCVERWPDDYEVRLA